ncbi:MAG TPA: hypothetical protein VFA16_21955, partial [Mycobacterium sp.]|uniref:hypothetical protein n=1 Tax=Mycobacterium sp. TaxID=1785 RepID=UPI002D520D3B
FGNIYEAVVKMPERLAAQPSPSVLGPGSPLRYYAPVAPITVAATVAALGAGWRVDGARWWLATTASCGISGLAISGYLIRRVNLTVIFPHRPPPPAECDALIASWYRLNLVRIAAAGGALFAAYRTHLVVTGGMPRRSAERRR